MKVRFLLLIALLSTEHLAAQEALLSDVELSDDAKHRIDELMKEIQVANRVVAKYLSW